MKILPYRIAGENVSVHVPETAADLDEFRQWVAAVSPSGRPIGADTETTSLDIFSPTFRIRCIQFGTETDAWVIPVEVGREFMAAAVYALLTLPSLVFHNAPFDALAIDRRTSVSLEKLWPRVTDTRLLAHLVDPRMEHEGGMGLKLKPLSALLIDPDAPDTQTGLHAEFRKIKKTKHTGWAAIDVWNPTYLLYAGLDAILAARLLPKLHALLNKHGIPKELGEFEHVVARICAQMRRRGMLVDVDYTRELSGRLSVEQEKYAAVAARYGVKSVNAPAQVAAALLGMGERWREKTNTGNPSTGREVLLPMADLDRDWQRIGARTPNPLADAVLRSKRAGKWRTSYADAMLSGVDADGRIHPGINSLQARTARMSISEPALQQLPSGDWTIRRALMADEGNRIVSVDYAAVEMRVLAAMAPEPVMQRAIAEGRDLHSYTAELVYGPGYTKQHRKIAKAIGFAQVYGGGIDTIERQTGAPRDAVEGARTAYGRVYPGIKKYSRWLAIDARRRGYEVRTPSGRRLPLDRDRVYACVNYAVQSSARDVLCQALVDMDARGLGDYLLLPVHDEVVAQAPAADAHDVAYEIARTMRMDFFNVPLDTDPDVGGRTWGSLYMRTAADLVREDAHYAANPSEAAEVERLRLAA